MSIDLGPEKPKNTYKALLNIGDADNGINAVLKNVGDGEGTDSALQLSTDAVNVDGDFLVGSIQFDPTGASNGDTLVFDGTSFVAQAPGGSGLNIDTSGAVADDILVFDGANFVAQAPAEVTHPDAVFALAASDEDSDLEVGTAKVTYRIPYDFELSAVRASVTTAPVGANLIIDIKVNGVSILSTLLSIDDGEKTSVTAATPAVIDTTSLTDDDEITIDITQVGSTTAGAGLKVTLLGQPQ